MSVNPPPLPPPSWPNPNPKRGQEIVEKSVRLYYFKCVQSFISLDCLIGFSNAILFSMGRGYDLIAKSIKKYET